VWGAVFFLYLTGSAGLPALLLFKNKKQTPPR
jgi:hypothetical protein